MDMWERCVGILLLVFSIAYLAGALSLPMGRPNQPGPGIFPVVLGIALVAVSIFHVVKVFLAKSPAKNRDEFPYGKDLLRVMGVVGVLVAYGLFLETLGYIVTTLVLFIWVLRFLGMRSWARLVLISIFGSAGSYYFFKVILSTPLPSGILFP